MFAFHLFLLGHFLPEERPTEVAQLIAELNGAPAEPYGCSP